MPVGSQAAAVKECLLANQVFQNILPQGWTAWGLALTYVWASVFSVQLKMLSLGTFIRSYKEYWVLDGSLHGSKVIYALGMFSRYRIIHLQVSGSSGLFLLFSFSHLNVVSALHFFYYIFLSSVSLAIQDLTFKPVLS